MDEYIEREALRDALYDADAITMQGVKLLNQFPAADVAPVRHGRWELYGNDDDISASYFCSLCGWNIDENEYLDYFSHYRYCPNCGAKMDEEVSE